MGFVDGSTPCPDQHTTQSGESGVLGQSPAQYYTNPFAPPIQIYQLCNVEGHIASFCGSKPPEHAKCLIYGMNNHTTWYCFYNDKGPNYVGPTSRSTHGQMLSPYRQSYPMSGCSIASPQYQSQHLSMQAMHTTMTSFSSPSNSQQSPQVWFTDSEATNHMTADLSNLSLASPYPSNETIQSSNCKW
ncbi:hypothetical protein ACFX2G_044300 [Malus domestica]